VESEELVAAYLKVQQQIAELKTKADNLKAELATNVQLSTAEQGAVWEYKGVGRAVRVKGRMSKKLDRTSLVLQGVTKTILDQATRVTVGEPTLRIEAWKDEDS